LVLGLGLAETFSPTLAIWDRTLWAKKLKIFFLVMGVPTVLLVNFVRTFEQTANWESYCFSIKSTQPCEAIRFLKETKPDVKNVFANYEWGGVLTWQLPNYRYFVDGRMPAWPVPDMRSPYTVYLDLMQAKSGYLQKLAGYGTDVIFVGSGSFLDAALQKEPRTNWKELYRDQKAVIYQKATAL